MSSFVLGMNLSYVGQLSSLQSGWQELQHRANVSHPVAFNSDGAFHPLSSSDLFRTHAASGARHGTALLNSTLLKVLCHILLPDFELFAQPPHNITFTSCASVFHSR